MCIQVARSNAIAIYRINSYICGYRTTLHVLAAEESTFIFGVLRYFREMKLEFVDLIRQNKP
jgi:hypothetical protein